MCKKLTARFSVIIVLIFILNSAVNLTAAEEYLSIDLTEVTTGETRGFDPSPFYLSRDLSSEDYFISILTLNSQNGTQMGGTLRMSMPPDDQMPAAILMSKHFGPSLTRGVEPSPFIVMRDYTIYYFPLAHELDGTPVMGGAWETIFVSLPAMLGDATCAAELPGSQFGDGKPRLYIGTADGYVFWLVNSDFGGITVEGAFTHNTGPIIDLEPIPQYGYIALGALTENTIYGFDPRTEKGAESRYAYNFRLSDPRTGSYMTDFDVIGQKDEPLGTPIDPVKLIIGNGTAELSIATLFGEEMGDVTMEITPDSREHSIGHIATNPLLMIPADQSLVLFDPNFNGDDGSSGCEMDITVPPDPCYGICGDVDNEGNINILDIVYLINYIYKSGPGPYILELANVDGIWPINILDIVYLINYIYKSGPDPNCP